MGFWFDLLIIMFRIKGQAASKYGLTSQPRLVDIIAAVPPAYKKVRDISLNRRCESRKKNTRHPT